MTPARERWDVVVVGAGLSGLSAALHLQRRGHRVLVVERRSQPGGLCGTTHSRGYEFALACNDFGEGLVRMLRELGVAVEFRRVATRFHLAGQILDLPLRVPTLLRLAPDLPGLLRFA